MIAAVIVCDLSPIETRRLARQRLVGSVLGAGVGATVSTFLPASAWVLGLGVAVAMFLSHPLGLPGAARLSGYISGIVVLGFSNDPWTYSAYRLLETLLGVTMAVLVSLVPKWIQHDHPAPQAP